MKKYGQIAFIFILAVISLGYMDVDALVKQFNMCSDNTLYSIIFDTDVNTQVTEDKINPTSLHDGFVDDINDKAHSFEVSTSGSKCFVENGQIKKCPTSDNLSITKINETYINADTSGVTSNISMDLDENSGAFNITIKDKFNGKMKIRYVHSGLTANAGSGSSPQDASAFPASDFISRNSDGTYRITGVGANKSVKLEFFLNTDDVCNNTFLGHIIFFTPDASDYMIKNPAKSNPEAYGCDAVKNYKPDGMPNKTDELENLNKTKREVVNYCYMDKIKYGEKANLKKIISDQYGALIQLYEIYKVPTRDATKGTCQEETTQTKNSTYSKTGSYWAIVCNEVYTASGDKPKLVKAGGGFAYESTFSVTKTCRIINVYNPSLKPKCRVETSVDCFWIGVTGIVHTGDVPGPNADFDGCVKKCDGGKYTQKCINSCYKESYKKERKISLIDEIANKTEKDNNIKQTSSCSGSSVAPGDYNAADVGTVVGHRNTWNGTDADPRVHYNPANVYEFQGVQCTVSSWCDSRGYGCTYHVNIVPDGCSWCPDEEYCGETSSSESELRGFEHQATKYLDANQLGEYTYTITDSYYNNGSYRYVVNSKDNPALQVTRSDEDLGTETAGFTIGTADHYCTRNVSYTRSASRKTTVTVRLPYSYVNKITSDATYKSDENTSTRGYIIDPSHTSLVQEPKNDKIKYDTGYYHEPGERKYYTSIYSPNINVNISDKDVTLKEPEKDPDDYTAWNIKVQSVGLGDGNFGSDIYCYYGVYNQFRKCTGPNCPKDACDPKVEVCDGNIQYIFRPIELSDVFPNDRGPRFNWSCRANLQEWYRQNVYKTDVAPVLLTKEIQSKGETIYDNPSELDYEFTLTGSNIRAIKEYNDSVADFNKDGNKNYLDYDVTNCKASGCESAFLNDNKYVTFTKRGKELVGCNNGINGECDTSINLSSRDMCRGSYGNVQSPPDSDCSQTIYPVE